MDADTLRQIIARDEGQTVEFKLESEKQSDLAAKVICKGLIRESA